MVYKGGTISIAIARMLVKIRFISLVNLIMDRKVVTELIQEDCNTVNITDELLRLIDGPGRTKIMEDYRQLSVIMGEPGASARTASLISAYLLKG